MTPAQQPDSPPPTQPTAPSTQAQPARPTEPAPPTDPLGPAGETPEPLVRLEIADGVARIVLDSPRNRNALSRALRAELRQAWRSALADPAVRVLVLTHTGPVFCAGMDLKETAVEQPGSEGVRELPELLQLVARSPKPVIAALAGPARAGGIGLAAAADLVVAAPTATFAFSEVRIGLIPAVISVPVLDRMHPVIARELLLTGEVFDAATALRAGLLNAVADDAGPASGAGVQRVVDGWVTALKAGGPTALAGTKALLRRGFDDSDERYADLLELSARQFSSDEAREGATAFAQKRAPAW